MDYSRSGSGAHIDDAATCLATCGGCRGFVHCNFGWNGASDGFYTSGIFNSNRPRLNDFGRELSGKTPGLWDENIQILTYTDVRL